MDAKRVTGWVLTGILSLGFLFFGSGKFLMSDVQTANFIAWGYPSWFAYVIGSVEILAGLLVWHPKTMFYGVKLVGAVMVGAAITHIVHGEWMMLPLNAGLIALAAAVAMVRRQDWPAWVTGIWNKAFGKA